MKLKQEDADRTAKNPNYYLSCFQSVFYELKHRYLDCVEDFCVEDLDFTKEPWHSMTGNEVFETMTQKLGETLHLLDFLDINKKGNLFVFHYNENAVFDADTLSWLYLNEARGLVLDMDKEQPVIVPFKKFRNLNETEEYHLHNIEEMAYNTYDFEISEKLDGSMISVAMYEGKLVVATGHHLDPKISMQIGLAEKYITQGITDMITSNPDKTFIFELLDRHDPHIVSYKGKDFGLHLIGIRDNKTGHENSYLSVQDIANKYKVKTTGIIYGKYGHYPKENLKNLWAVLEKLSKPQKDLKEGYVVKMDNFRFKIKYDDYIKVFKTLPGNSVCPRYVLQSIADNTIDDFYSHIPINRQSDVKEIIDNVRQYRSLKDEETTEYYLDAISHSTDRKSFMLYSESFPDDIKANVRNRYNKTEPELSRRYIISKAGKVKNYREIEDFLEQAIKTREDVHEIER